MDKNQSPTVKQALQYAEETCAARGARFTEKRKQVFEVLADNKKALSAYELIDCCRAKFGSQFPAMSIYRILDFLEDVGLVHRLDSAKKYVACSHNDCSQEHKVSQFLICKSCYLVEEISIGKEFMTSLRQNAEKAGFRLTSQELELDSVCGNCSE